MALSKSYQKYAAAAQAAKAPVVQKSQATQTSQVAQSQKPSGTMSFLGKAAQIAKIPSDIFIGTAKGVGSTIAGAASLGEKALNMASEKLFPNLGIKGEDKTFGQNLQDTALKAEGTTQKIAKGAEQVAEMFVPVGTGKISQAAKASKYISKLPKYVQMGAEIAGKAIGEGAEALTKTAVQEGEINEDAKNAGLFSAGASAAGSVIAPLAQKLGNFALSKVVPSTPKQKAIDVAQGINVGEAIKKTGFSLNKKDLVGKLEKNIQSLGKDIGSAIDDAVDEGAGVYTIDDVLKNVKENMKDKALVGRLEATPIDMPKVNAVIDDTIARYKETYGDTPMDLKALQKIKVELGDGLEKEFQRSVGAPIKAKPLTEMVIRRSLKNIIKEEVPKVDGLNKQLAPLLVASKRLGAKGEYSGLLTDVIVGAAIASANPMEIIQDPVSFAKKVATGIVAKHALTSTASKTLTGLLTDHIAKIAENPQFANSLFRAIQISNEDTDDED